MRSVAPLPGSREEVWGPHGLHVLLTDCAVRALHLSPSSRAWGRPEGLWILRTQDWGGEGQQHLLFLHTKQRGTLSSLSTDYAAAGFYSSFGKHHTSHFGYFTSMSTGAKGERDDGTGNTKGLPWLAQFGWHSL